jgi:hypothetical protein
LSAPVVKKRQNVELAFQTTSSFLHQETKAAGDFVQPDAINIIIFSV